MTHRRIILLHISDSHGGHRLGLMNPATRLEDQDELGNLYSYTPTMTAVQRWLWYDVYLPTLQSVEDLAAGDEIAVWHTGDPTHGNAHPDQLVGTRPSDQIEIACNDFRPVLRLPNIMTMRFASSTGAHSFGEGSSDFLIARQLQAEFPKADIRVVQHGLADFDGLLVDYAHHGPGPGGRNWLKGNVARYYLRSLMMDDIMEGNRPPNLVLRGHYHDPIIETLRLWYHDGLIESNIVIAPPLCGLSYWTHQAIKSPYILRAGMMAYEFIDGHLVDFYPFVHTVDQRTKEAL